MSNRREFLQQMLAGAAVAAIASGTGFAGLSFKADAALMMKARNLEFFDVNGQRVFAVYDASGGLRVDQIFYLVEPKTKRVLGVSIGGRTLEEGDLAVTCREAVREGCRRFDAESNVVDFDGGNMGTPIRYERAA